MCPGMRAYPRDDCTVLCVLLLLGWVLSEVVVVVGRDTGTLMVQMHAHCALTAASQCSLSGSM